MSDRLLKLSSGQARIVPDDELTSEGWTWRTAADLAEPVPPTKFLIEQIWPEYSFGPWAGQKKTLKSYNALVAGVAVASGLPYLGQFAVPEPGPVAYIAAEGGSGPFQRRFQAVCAGYGLLGKKMRGLPFFATHDRDSLGTLAFVTELERLIDREQPRVIVLDSLYNVHAAGVETSNLYERGKMLADLSAITEGRCALWVVDHFKKSAGSTLDLHDISMAGVGEWADSWVLQRHRTEPDLDRGEYRLEVQYGSRQGPGGIERHLDLTVPPDRDGLIGPVRWKVSAAEKSAKGSRSDSDRSAIEQVLRDTPDGLTKTRIRELAGGNAKRCTDELDRMAATGRVVTETTTATDARGRKQPKTLYVLAPLRIRVDMSSDRPK